MKIKLYLVIPFIAFMFFINTAVGQAPTIQSSNLSFP